MEEIWKDVVGYEGLYQVSNLGRTKSLDRIVSTGKGMRKHHGKILIQQLDGQKHYFQVSLSKNGKVKKIQVHCLVAQTFIPNPKNKPEVNHIDGNKQNNNVTNLEWVTTKENMQHALRKKLRPLIKVKQYDLRGNFIKEWESISQAEESFNSSGTGISSCLNGKCQTAYGYIWKYSKDNSKIMPFKSYRRKICQYKLDGTFLKIWNSMNEIEKKLKIRRSNIWICCQGKQKTAGGYIWQYSN